MKEEIYYTSSMYEAAALLSCRDFEADYDDILPPEENSNRSKFVLKIYADGRTLREYLKNYRNDRTLVPPKIYDEKINMLRDILNKNKVR